MSAKRNTHSRHCYSPETDKNTLFHWFKTERARAYCDYTLHSACFSHHQPSSVKTFCCRHHIKRKYWTVHRRRPIKTATASPAILQGHRGRDSQRLKYTSLYSSTSNTLLTSVFRWRKKKKNVQKFRFKYFKSLLSTNVPLKRSFFCCCSEFRTWFAKINYHRR